ncbi:hypothetical protein MLD38_001598 [Melastoma candidum]|uniref:Uncharacterized protein n=1 Tax=Melastoma candidum TaxID=119954 RepID=A0ACB9SDP5_9MYRT|nr:hypothetical protein MLD38_001598 [Melastoma candidum]
MTTRKEKGISLQILRRKLSWPRSFLHHCNIRTKSSLLPNLSLRLKESAIGEAVKTVIMMLLVDLRKFLGALAVVRVALAYTRTLWTRMVRMPVATVGHDSSPSTFCTSPCPFPKVVAVAKVLAVSGGVGCRGFQGTAVLADVEPHFSQGGVSTREADACVSSGKCSMTVMTKTRKRPTRLVLPDVCPVPDCSVVCTTKEQDKVVEERGRDYFLACKKGRRDVMEDGHNVITNISGDPRKAFFSVIDGHGGRPAVNYVTAHLGKNIIREIENAERNMRQTELEEDCTKGAICDGYLATDKGFLSQGLASGACVASALLKDGQLYVANLGDCRVVLCRNEVAEALTTDHRVGREDERLRIENVGGFVHNRNGVWRVHGSLAVSRAIGDLHLKEYIISEPDIRIIRLDSDCRFLIMASDGLWDKVSEQEAVDVVGREGGDMEKGCKKLIELSSSRGNLDDITVLLINLQSFVLSPT